MLVTGLSSGGAPLMRIDGCGAINVLAAHHGKLLLCSDDGQQATLQVWDTCAKLLVQELGGIRKWNAPTSVCYMGHDRCFWVRDNVLCTMRWKAHAAPPPEQGADEQGAAAAAV